MKRIRSFTVASASLMLFLLLLPTAIPSHATTPKGQNQGQDQGQNQGQDTSQNPVIAFRNVRVFDGTQIHEAMTVLVTGDTITAVGPDLAIPAAAQVIEGAGKTLMPGLIDAHTHAWGDALERALQFGVTTEIDMFTDHAFAADRRAEQAHGEAHGRADLVSAGTLVTIAGGHGTEYGIAIATLDHPDQADAFVTARLAEGSDFIKIVYDDAGGRWPTLDAATLGAVITAAHAHESLAVVHVSDFAAARTAITLGADGLVHVWSDRPADDAMLALAADRGVFVIPTLSIIATVAGTPNVTELDQDPALAPYLTPGEAGGLGRMIEGLPTHPERLSFARQATAALARAGVPILAGTDAPNPGTAHGVSLHGELALLIEAGLSPAEALAAATAVPARVFGLDDRGRIAPGLRADLLLVDGDPTRDITRTRHIVGIWKGGRAIERQRGDAALEGRTSAAAASLFAHFDQGALDAAFGFGWQPTTDRRMGGSSEVTHELVSPGALDTAGALSLHGIVKPGFAFPWAGIMIFPGDQPMEPVDFSAKKEVVFFARGDGGSYRLMLFAESLGQIPASEIFVAGEGWQEHRIALRDLADDLRGVWGLAFVAGPAQGNFAFEIDQVSIR